MNVSQQATTGHLIVGGILVVLALVSFIATYYMTTELVTFAIFFFGVWGGVENRPLSGALVEPKGPGSMTTIANWTKRHPTALFWVLTFATSWGGILLIVGPNSIPGTTAQIDVLFPYVLLILLVGPPLAGLLATLQINGRAGMLALWARATYWRVSVGWYVIALMATPLLVALILFPLALVSAEFLPAVATTDDRFSLVLLGVAIGLMGGILEELGWTGFAVPQLRKRYGIFATGFIVGLMWGVWHLLVTFWASGDASGRLAPAMFFPPVVFYLAVLPVYRILMVWVCDRTSSLLIAMLMHASLTASTLFIMQPAATALALVSYYIILTAALWIILAMIAISTHVTAEWFVLEKWRKSHGNFID